MILTGKCLEAFKNWCNTESISYIDILGLEAYLNALTIDFFDSIKYSENTSLWEYCFEYEYSNSLKTFKHIVEQAIKKANEIYNNKC